MREETLLKRAFASDVLNSLSAHIAVLDAQGEIVAVNDAWRRFAGENGGDEERSYVGANYLAACERAIHGDGDEVAAAVVRGIRDVLRGERNKFSVEYPCHGPSAKRWFIVHVTCFRHRGATYLVTVHEDITARKLAEDALRETEATLQRVLAREQRKARTDDLTGLCNRRHFFELSGHLFAVAQRYRTPLSVFLFDVDHFKQVNDQFGHQVGDRVLERVAQLARGHLRAADVLARYGGEEFVVTLPSTNAEEAFAAAEKIRRRIAAYREPVDPLEVSITISAGVAGIEPDEDTLDHLIHRADQALYAAKSAGRNCSRIFAPVA